MKHWPLQVFALLFFLFGQIYVTAQNNAIDSLSSVLKTEKEDTNKVNTLVLLGGFLSGHGKPDSAVQVSDKALELSQKLNFQHGIQNSYCIIAGIYKNQGKFDKAKEYYLSALKAAEILQDKKAIAIDNRGIGLEYMFLADYSRAFDYEFKALKISGDIDDKPGIAKANGFIGMIYTHQGDIPKALEYDLKAEAMSEEIGDKISIAVNAGGLGIVYRKLGEYENSIKYYSKAILIFEEMGNKTGVAVNTGNIGVVYNDMGKYSKSIQYDLKAIKLDEELGDKQAIADEIGNIAEDYNKMDSASKALEYNMKALELFKEMNDKSGIMSDFLNIANDYVTLKNYGKAADYFSSSLSIAKEIGSVENIKYTNEGLSNVYAATGKWEKAYYAYKEFTIAKDSLTNEDKSKQIGKLEAKADFDKQLAVRQAEDDKNAVIAAADSKRQRIMLFFVVAITLAISAIAIVIFRSLRVTRKQKSLIERQKTIVEEQKIAVEEQKKIVEEKNKEVLDSITYAKRLQDAILPPLSIIKKYFPESFVLYKPKDIVAGDFYWMERTGDNILIAACDCTGHGVPGAMVSVVCSNALNRTVKEFHITDTGKILDKVRELVLETFEKSESEVKDGMDISLCCINTDTREIQWSGAYNPLWYVQNNEIKELAPDKQPIGKQEGQKPFSSHSLKLQKGDTLYLFTDGYADQFGGPKGKKFKYKQLEDKLLAMNSISMDKQKEMLDETIESWKGNLEQIDDVLVMGIRV